MMRIPVMILLLLLLAGFCLAQDVAKAAGETVREWPMIDHDAGRSGCSPDPRVKPPFRVKWITLVPGMQRKTLCVAAGKVFANGYCLDAETGEVLWRYPAHGGTPACDGKRLYILSGRAALDLATRKILWRRPGAGSSANSGGPVFDDGMIYTMAATGEGVCTQALACETGRIVWSTRITGRQKPLSPSSALYVHGGRSGTSPTAGGGRVFGAMIYPRIVFALDQKTGKELWRREGITAQRAVSTDGETVWAAESRQGVWALEAATGKPRWHWGGGHEKACYNMFGSSWKPPLVRRRLLVFSEYRNFSGHEPTTGKELWRAGDTGYAGGCGAPTFAGDFV